MKLAIRHYCQHAGNISAGTRHSEGSGRPTRKACRWCGGRFTVEHGVFGVFAWTGSGRYPLSDALATFTSRGQAETYATDTDLIVRWITILSESRDGASCLPA